MPTLKTKSDETPKGITEEEHSANTLFLSKFCGPQGTSYNSKIENTLKKHYKALGVIINKLSRKLINFKLRILISENLKSPPFEYSLFHLNLQ